MSHPKQAAPAPHRLPYRSRPLFHSSAIVLPQERPPPRPATNAQPGCTSLRELSSTMDTPRSPRLLAPDSQRRDPHHSLLESSSSSEYFVEETSGSSEDSDPDSDPAHFISYNNPTTGDPRAGDSTPTSPEANPSDPAEHDVRHKTSASVLKPEVYDRECEPARLMSMRTIIRLSDSYELDSRPRGPEGSGLILVSDPQEVLIRARGSNLFLLNADHAPTMRALSPERLSQAVFLKKVFFDETRFRTVTSFLHRSSQCYLAVSPDTREVRLIQAAPASEDESDASPGVVSLNGPRRASPPSEDELPDPQGPEPCCLFLVMDKGPACLQPVLCPNTSLGLAAGDDDHHHCRGLRVVGGREWNFKILPAQETEKLLSRVPGDLRGLLKRSVLAVRVTTSKPRCS